MILGFWTSRQSSSVQCLCSFTHLNLLLANSALGQHPRVTSSLLTLRLVFAIPGSDAIAVLAAEEPFKDLRTHAKYFQSAEGQQVFVMPSSQLSWCVWTTLVC